MTPEPLKNKICIADGISSVTNFQIRNSKDYEEAKKRLNEEYFQLEDIESAVDWLKDSIINLRKSNEVYHMSDDECLNYIEDKIDEAFPDLK